MRPRLQFGPRVPGLPFASAVRVDDVLYLSGVIGTGADGKLAPDADTQFRQTMDNITAVLAAHGATMADVFKCTVMLSDMGLWGEFNRVYLGYFPPDRLPARSAFGTAGLALGAFVEVECLAFAPQLTS